MSYAILLVGTLLIVWLGLRLRARAILTSRQRAHRAAIERARQILVQLRPSGEAELDLSAFPAALHAAVSQRLERMSVHVAIDPSRIGEEAEMRALTSDFLFVKRALTDGFSSTELAELQGPSGEVSASSTPRT
jgi:hypothetical protein